MVRLRLVARLRGQHVGFEAAEVVLHIEGHRRARRIPSRLPPTPARSTFLSRAQTSGKPRSIDGVHRPSNQPTVSGRDSRWRTVDSRRYSISERSPAIQPLTRFPSERTALCRTFPGLRRPNYLACLWGFGANLLEARGGIEPPNKGFADLCLTTWLPRLAHTLRTLPQIPHLKADPPP